MTEHEKQSRINALAIAIESTRFYQDLYLEGIIDEEEYQPYHAQRVAYLLELRELKK